MGYESRKGDTIPYVVGYESRKPYVVGYESHM